MTLLVDAVVVVVVGLADAAAVYDVLHGRDLSEGTSEDIGTLDWPSCVLALNWKVAVVTADWVVFCSAAYGYHYYCHDGWH